MLTKLCIGFSFFLLVKQNQQSKNLRTFFFVCVYGQFLRKGWRPFLLQHFPLFLTDRTMRPYFFSSLALARLRLTWSIQGNQNLGVTAFFSQEDLWQMVVSGRATIWILAQRTSFVSFCELFTFGLTSNSHGTSLLWGEKNKFHVLDFFYLAVKLLFVNQIDQRRSVRHIMSMYMCHSNLHWSKWFMTNNFTAR